MTPVCCTEEKILDDYLTYRWKSVRQENAIEETRFPRVGQVFLSRQTFYPGNNCPVGQNFLGKCVPLTQFPADTFSYHNITSRLDTV